MSDETKRAEKSEAVLRLAGLVDGHNIVVYPWHPVNRKRTVPVAHVDLYHPDNFALVWHILCWAISAESGLNERSSARGSSYDVASDYPVTYFYEVSCLEVMTPEDAAEEIIEFIYNLASSGTVYR